jgi:single-stranded-DNA-specific exonuclease
MTEDEHEANTIARELEELNRRRQELDRGTLREASRMIDALDLDATYGIVLGGHGWHPGVIGIVAGRIKEKTGKPALVVALDRESGQGKGSGRSISGVDLGAAIIGAKDNGLLVAGGGHAMAAGLTVEERRLDELAEWLDAQLAPAVARASGERAVTLDLALAPGGLTPQLVETLEAAGPFGVGWPAPRVAVGPVRLVRAELVGSDHVRLIAAGQDGASFKAIAFRAAETELGQTLLHGAAGRRLWLAGRPKIDDWGSRPQAELHLEDAAWAD